MANNTLSLNSIKNIFYSISVAHQMLNDFGYGPTYDITTKPRRYPLLWVEPSSNSAEMVDGRIQQFNYSFSIGVWDKIKKGDINFDDTLSDTNAIHQHIVSLISQHPLYAQLNLSLAGSVIWEPYIHEEDADLNGYVATLTFKVPNRFNPCNIPVLPTLSYSESLGPNTVEYRLIGPQGFTGPQGAIGPTGLDGIIGANGATGSQGPQGVQGNQGTGVQGPTGETGLQGNQGPQGEIGYQGNQGDIGPIGYQGIDGSQGNQGVQGNQGSQGPQGNQGVQGILGLTGPQGLLGSQGNQGVKGNQGDFGPIGPAGLIWRGLWSSTSTYSINDSVGYASASWFLYTASIPPNYYGPTSAPPNTDFGHWALLAAQGAPGQMGPQGWQGIIGPTGASGVLGSTASSSVSADMDNFGEVITTGSKGYVRMPYNATIIQWSMLADQTGSAVIDIRRNGSSIVGSGNKPTLVSAQSGLTAIAGWTASTILRNDVLEWVVESASTITRLNVALFLTRGV